MNKKELKAIGSVAALALIGGGVIWAAVGIPQITTASPEATPAAVSVFEINGFAEAPPKATQPASATVVVEEAAPVIEDVSGAPGDPVPFIPSSDPNNANGGDYIDPGIYCLSGSASTIGGVPVCD